MLLALTGNAMAGTGIDRPLMDGSPTLYPYESIVGKTGRLRVVTRGCSSSPASTEIYAPSYVYDGDRVTVDVTALAKRSTQRYILQIWKSPIVAFGSIHADEIGYADLRPGERRRVVFDAAHFSYHVSVGTCAAPAPFRITVTPVHRAVLSIRQLRPISNYRFVAIASRRPDGGDAWGLTLDVRARWDGRWHALPTHYKTSTYGWSEGIRLPPGTRGKEVTFDVTATEQFYRTEHLRQTILINP